MSTLNSDQVDQLLRSAERNAVVYLVGAGGCGMSGLGHLLLDLGHRVAGSDLALNEDVQQLRARGAEIHLGHTAGHIMGAQPVLVVYSSAIRLENPELQAARQLQIPMVRRATLLAALMHRQRGICIAGMHGKTTSTAWLAFALEQLTARPSYAIGAHVPQLARHASFQGESRARGEGDPKETNWFVIEADESDGSLVEFKPEHSIILNIDEEHLDYYANLEAICREFERFTAATRGSVIFCADDSRLAELLARHPQTISYGFNPLATYRVTRLTKQNANSTFEVSHAGLKLGDFGTELVGEKNVSNATAVIALLHHLGFAPERIASAIAGFRGATRRQDEVFRDHRFRVFDDYGHHPSEICATLRAFQELGGRRLLVAFQPHRFTRTQRLLQKFANCFRGADRLWLTEVYSANEDAIPGVNSSVLGDAIRAQGQAVEYCSSLDELRRSVRAAMQPGDVILFLGAGDITNAAHQLADQLRQETPMLKEQWQSELAAKFSIGSVLRCDEPLAKRTTLRVGGTADFYVEPASEADLAAVLEFCRSHELPFYILGRGSNLLIKDGGIRGMVISLSQPHFSGVEIAGDHLHAGAGARLKAVAVAARRHSLAGLEFLEGIPGSVGGGLRMNAGAMGSWMFDVVESIRFMDYSGNTHERRAGEVNVEYRGCPLFKDHVALGAVLKGRPAPRELIEQRMQSFSRKRWDTQPAAASAGCIFKNPKTIPAGKLIEELGLKGTRIGAAVVSAVHGNFIVNEGGATAQDVLKLIETIKQRARDTRGIELETEVEIVGE
ncbi:MAG: UDP-N-acetylenolpyruvoylglucosamine reductase [Verrucomicrobia bacterium]|nr:MAG: UDP-N-acetylenolpyruvoylglucosamine reductase [Verrucomicrobiota bacterium]